MPDSLFPYEISYVLMVSPCRAKEVNYDWTDLCRAAVRHRSVQIRQGGAASAHGAACRTQDYWDKDRVPKQDRLVLMPMPEASTRTAALLSGQVNWVEAPSPDAIDRLKSPACRSSPRPTRTTGPISSTSCTGRSPTSGSARRPITRSTASDMKDLLNGLMLEEYATVPPSTPYYGNPVRYEYDPDKAKALLKEAGCLPCKVTFAISTSGSGQMQPLPMNELVKSQLDAAGFEVDAAVDGLERAAEVGRARRREVPRHRRDQYQPRRRRTRSTR